MENIQVSLGSVLKLAKELAASKTLNKEKPVVITKTDDNNIIFLLRFAGADKVESEVFWKKVLPTQNKTEDTFSFSVSTDELQEKMKTLTQLDFDESTKILTISAVENSVRFSDNKPVELSCDIPVKEEESPVDLDCCLTNKTYGFKYNNDGSVVQLDFKIGQQPITLLLKLAEPGSSAELITTAALYSNKKALPSDIDLPAYFVEKIKNKNAGDITNKPFKTSKEVPEETKLKVEETSAAEEEPIKEVNPKKNKASALPKKTESLDTDETVPSPGDEKNPADSSEAKDCDIKTITITNKEIEPSTEPMHIKLIKDITEYIQEIIDAKVALEEQLCEKETENKKLRHTLTQVKKNLENFTQDL